MATIAMCSRKRTRKTSAIPLPPNCNPNPKLCRTNFCSDVTKQINFSSDTLKETQFPADLIEEILLRLEVKALLRFKCVSKQWFFLISHSRFIARHLKSKKTRQDFILLSRIPEDKFGIATLYNYGDGIHIRSLEAKFPSVQPSETFCGIVGHCDGLLCVRFYSKETDRRSFVVWNPSTKKQRKFQLPECRGNNIECMGFGYDPVGDDYKVLLVTTGVSRKIQSFSLNTCSWKAFENAIPYRFKMSGGSPLGGKHVKGCIYWIIAREIEGNYRIACFDLRTDTVREEESLSGVFWYYCCYNQLSLLGESLCLVRCHEHTSFDVLVMKEDEVTQTKSWIKLFTIRNFITPFMVARKEVILPLCITGTDKVVIYSGERGEYVLFDPSDHSVYKVAEFGDPIKLSLPMTPFVESLVSPNRFSSISYI